MEKKERKEKRTMTLCTFRMDGKGLTEIQTGAGLPGNMTAVRMDANVLV